MGVAYSVLLLEGSDEGLADLAERLAAIGLGALRAKTPDDAARLLQGSRSAPVKVVCLAASLWAAGDLAPWLRLLRHGDATLPALVVGRRLDLEARRKLREAGLWLALWEPFDDGSLRFQLNRCLHGAEDDGDARDKLRVPTPLLARVVAGAGAREAIVYNLSVSGAFLETPRALMRGAKVVVELPLPELRLHLEGRVVYANVPGNLERPNLPHGMGVTFDAPAAEATAALRRYVEERARAFEL